MSIALPDLVDRSRLIAHTPIAIAPSPKAQKEILASTRIALSVKQRTHGFLFQTRIFAKHELGQYGFLVVE